MELLWKEEIVEALAAREKIEIKLEGEVPPPEGRECASPLAALCSVEEGRCICSAENVRMEGVLLITLLCENGEGLYGFTSRAPFSQIYQEAGAEEARGVFCVVGSSLKLEEGTLRFSAELECDLLLSRSVSLRTLRGLAGLENEKLQLREQGYTLTRRLPGETARAQLREEISVSDAAEVLAASGAVFFKGAQDESAQAGLVVSALCRSGEGKLKQIVRQLPLHLEEDIEDAECDGCSISELSLRSVGEEFGILAAEGNLRLETARSEKYECMLTLDAFSPSFPFECVYAEHTALCDMGARCYRHCFDAPLTLPEGLPEVAECVYCCARAIISSAATEDGRLFIEGLLDTRAVYKSAGGKMCCFSREVAFTADFPAPQADIIQCEAAAFVICDGSGSSLQAHYTLCIRARFNQSVPLRAVIGIKECEKEKPDPGLVILFAGAGESLFSIAKRYNVTLESLYALQSEIQEPLEEGQRLMLLV